MCPVTDRQRTCRRPVQRPLIKMADNSVSACMEQHVVMKFLVNEGVKPANIYRRLQAQYGDETLSRSKTFEWCKCFKDGRTSVSDVPGRGGSQPTAVISVNIQRVEHLILDKRRITCHEIAQETNLSVGMVFWVMCICICRKNSLVWSLRASCFSRTLHDLILLTTLRAHYSNSAGRYCHIPLTAQASLRVISTCLDP